MRLGRVTTAVISCRPEVFLVLSWQNKVDEPLRSLPFVIPLRFGLPKNTTPRRFDVFDVNQTLKSAAPLRELANPEHAAARPDVAQRKT